MEMTKIGWICYCPQCERKTQTTRCACGCGNCTVCDYRWCCYGDAPIYSCPFCGKHSGNKLIKDEVICKDCGRTIGVGSL